jgi:hypothetical protein
VQQVEAAAAGPNPVNPAVEGLLVPQLTQLAAAVFPWGVLCGVLEGAVAAASEALMRKVRLKRNVVMVLTVCRSLHNSL